MLPLKRTPLIFFFFFFFFWGGGALWTWNNGRNHNIITHMEHIMDSHHWIIEKTRKRDGSLSGHWMGHLLSYSLSGGHDGAMLPIGTVNYSQKHGSRAGEASKTTGSGYRARFLSLARSKLRLCSANHRPGYWSNLPCDWPSTAWAYSEQETENGPWSALAARCSLLTALYSYIVNTF